MVMVPPFLHFFLKAGFSTTQWAPIVVLSRLHSTTDENECNPPVAGLRWQNNGLERPTHCLMRWRREGDFSATYTLAHFREWWGQRLTRDRWAVKWVKDVILLKTAVSACLFHSLLCPCVFVWSSACLPLYSLRTKLCGRVSGVH